MKTIISKTFRASATFGLFKKYSSNLIHLEDFKKVLAEVQKAIYETKNIVLSTKITGCEIVCLGQEEPSVTLEWIQYPKFEIEENLLKEAIMELVKNLMDLLNQNRVVVVFDDTTTCLEVNSKIDPKIKL